jgi:hypothetical protein
MVAGGSSHDSRLPAPSRSRRVDLLIVFDHQAARLLAAEPFGTDGDRAVAAYSAKEQEYQDRPMVEIVLIGSDSLETVKKTHANYFDESIAISKYLTGV